MVRSAISCALLFITGCVFGQTGKSKVALGAAQHSAAIDAVREYALRYTKSLPNYTCTLTTRETARLPGNNISIRTTVIDEQLSFVDTREVRRITRIDGHAVSAREAGKQPAAMSEGEFGNLLDIIFEPATGADLRWDRAATLNRRTVDVLAYRVPQSKGYVLAGSSRSAQVPFEGFVYADAQTHAVLRIQMKCVMIPYDSEYQAVDLTLDYKAARVADREFILPSHFALNYRTPDHEQANAADYTNYRRFSADATIQFEGDQPQP